MRNAFMLLGVMTVIVSIGAFIAFSKKGEVPQEFIHHIETNMSLTLSSPVFEDGGSIPSQYTCDAENINPELHIHNVPEGTQSLVLVMDDPDISEAAKIERGIDVVDHWVLYNIDPTTSVITEGATIGEQGLNVSGQVGYRGPCPPDREHRYFFRLYAISGTLSFVQTPTLKEVEDAARSMMIEQTTLMGRYKRIGVE